MQHCLLVMKYAFLSILLFCKLHAQFVNSNVLDVDSFPSFVSAATLSGEYMVVEDTDTNFRPTNKRAMTYGPDGKWITRDVLFTDGDVSHDTMSFDSKTRTRRERSANGYNPSTTTTVYNADGTVATVHYHPEQREEIFYVYEYDKLKRLVRMTETFGEWKMVEQYYYNKSNQLIRKTISSGGVLDKKNPGLENEKLFAYGPHGKCVLLLDNHYGTTGEIRVRDTISYEYDSLNRLIVQKEIRQNGEVTSIRNYTYDAAGRVIEVTWMRVQRDNPEKVPMRDVYDYDDHGYFTSHAHHNFFGMHTITWQITYNDKGLPESCLHRDGDDVFRYTWTYVYR